MRRRMVANCQSASRCSKRTLRSLTSFVLDRFSLVGTKINVVKRFVREFMTRSGLDLSHDTPGKKRLRDDFQ